MARIVRTVRRLTRGEDRLTRLNRAEALRYGEVAMLGLRERLAPGDAFPR